MLALDPLHVLLTNGVLLCVHMALVGPPAVRVTDIPHRGSDFGEFLSVKPCRTISQELEQVLVLFGQVEHEGPCAGEASHMHPDKGVEHPPGSGRLDTLAFLVRNCRPVVLERVAEAVFQGRIDQQTPRHHHQEGHEALGLCERQGGGQKVRGFEQPTAACGILLAFRACEQLLGWSPGVVECIGGEEEAPLLVDKRLPGSA